MLVYASISGFRLKSKLRGPQTHALLHHPRDPSSSHSHHPKGDKGPKAESDLISSLRPWLQTLHVYMEHVFTPGQAVLSLETTETLSFHQELKSVQPKERKKPNELRREETLTQSPGQSCLQACVCRCLCLEWAFWVVS